MKKRVIIIGGKMVAASKSPQGNVEICALRTDMCVQCAFIDASFKMCLSKTDAITESVFSCVKGSQSSEFSTRTEN